MKYQLVPEQKGELEVNSIEKDEDISVETKYFVKEFPKLFERQEKVKNHKVKLKFKADAKLSQQTGRRIPIQLQMAVDEEIDRLLKGGHNEKIIERKNDVLSNRQ